MQCGGSSESVKFPLSIPYFLAMVFLKKNLQKQWTATTLIINLYKCIYILQQKKNVIHRRSGRKNAKQLNMLAPPSKGTGMKMSVCSVDVVVFFFLHKCVTYIHLCYVWTLFCLPGVTHMTWQSMAYNQPIDRPTNNQRMPGAYINRCLLLCFFFGVFFLLLLL